MAFYVKQGTIPDKKHITFFKEDGKSLYREELFSTKGFSNIYSNKYHCNMPPIVEGIAEIETPSELLWDNAPVKYYHFLTEKIEGRGDILSSRKLLLHNKNCKISVAKIDEEQSYFYRNSTYSELLFIDKGAGILETEYGNIHFEEWDYLVIPKGTTYFLRFNDYKKNKLLIIESDTPFEIPKHFRNEYGQLNEDAPYCERDFKTPVLAEPKDEQGDYKLLINLNNRLFAYKLKHHPFDVIGWDGFLYPFAFNLKSYDPKVGRIHLPPPVHLMFTTESFVVCNFCPRPFDFHPQAIPAPYFHSNIDSDEVIYYVEGDFMSRKGIEQGSVTLHPMGIPHGPQPGKTEESIGKKETVEYAVMIDTFNHLNLTLNVKKTEVKNYEQSWNQ